MLVDPQKLIADMRAESDCSMEEHVLMQLSRMDIYLQEISADSLRVVWRIGSMFRILVSVEVATSQLEDERLKEFLLKNRKQF